MAKKNWIYIKRGLSEDPKHRSQMGECIWLYMHIIDRADWETGIAYDWKDAQEAADMGLSVDTLRRQRQKLEEGDYIRCTQKQYKQEISIMEWKNPRDYSCEVKNPRFQSLDEALPSDVQGSGHGLNHVARQVKTPTLDSKSLSIDDSSKSKNTAYNRGEQERPDKMAEYAKLMNAPGLKTEIRIDSILSYLAETLRRNTHTKEWREFAKYIVNAQKTNGWQVETFVKWLLSQKGYDPQYWSVKKMTEFYPQAFISENTNSKEKPL